jgi:hypothetical protein
MFYTFLSFSSPQAAARKQVIKMQYDQVYKWWEMGKVEGEFHVP